MSISYERTGRTHQKARTRQALIAATRRLLAQGTTPTVEQAAAAAQISRATAYRYFPNQRALLAATYPTIDRRSLLPTPAPADPAARLAAVADAQTQQVLELEPELRTQLRLTLDPDGADRGQLPLRRGRRITWIQEALAQLRGRLPEELQAAMAAGSPTCRPFDADEFVDRVAERVGAQPQVAWTQVRAVLGTLDREVAELAALRQRLPREFGALMA